jgi:hypothetical protein
MRTTFLRQRVNSVDLTLKDRYFVRMTFGPRTLVLALALSFGAALPLAAQDASLDAQRTALTQYDITEGSRTLAALQELAPRAAQGSVEARYMRAQAATELYVAALVTHDEGLRTRLAQALGVPATDLATHLDTELRASGTGAFRQGALEGRDLLRAAVIAERNPADLFSHRSDFRDALIVLTIGAEGEAPLLSAPEACAANATPFAPCGWDERSRRRALDLHQAVLAHARIVRARAQGDALLVLLTPAVDAAMARIRAAALSPTFAPDASLAQVTAGTAAPALDALIAIGTDHIRITVTPRVRIGDAGELVWLRGSASENTTRIALPATSTPVAQPIDDLVSALRTLGLGALHVGVAMDQGAPFHLLSRTLLSAAQAEVPLTELIARGPEGLVVVRVRSANVSTLRPNDARVRVRLGGYGVARGPRGAEVSIVRVRGESGMAFDFPTLQSRLARMPHQALAFESYASLPAEEFLRVAFGIEASDGLILLTP